MKYTTQTRFSLARLLTFLLLVTFAASCGDDNDPVSQQPPEDLNIVDVAASNDEFSTLSSLIADLEMEDELAEADFTVFAPTNAAFDALPEGTIQSLTEDELRSIIRYHVVAGIIRSADIAAREDAETIQGERILLTSSGGVTINGNATVNQADIEASNGIIHGIDDVLLPSAFREPDIIEVAKEAGNFETLLGAIENVGLTTTFQFLGDFTVFAPSDDAFANLPDGFIDSLTEEQLTDILSYHVLSQVVLSTGLQPQGTATTLTGESLWIESDNGVTINDASTVTTADIEASNGVIHAVDAVLIPDAFGTVVDNAVKRFNFETLVSAVSDAGLAETLSGEGPFTVFAPTDEAFANLPSGLLESLSAEQLTQVLLYHVLPADIKSSDLQPEQAAEALSEENLFITVSNGDVSVNNRSIVTTPDIDALNGTIHGIDEVLLPNQFVDVADIANKNFDLSTLVTLLQNADLVETLKSEGPFTIFAPVNSAFEEISGTLDTLTPEQVSDVLTFHVVPQKILSSDLAPQQTVTTVNGEEIEVIVDGETVTVEGSATVTTVDLEGTNGVIHLIDSVLIPENL